MAIRTGYRNATPYLRAAGLAIPHEKNNDEIVSRRGIISCTAANFSYVAKCKVHAKNSAIVVPCKIKYFRLIGMIALSVSRFRCASVRRLLRVSARRGMADLAAGKKAAAVRAVNDYVKASF